MKHLPQKNIIYILARHKNNCVITYTKLLFKFDSSSVPPPPPTLTLLHNTCDLKHEYNSSLISRFTIRKLLHVLIAVYRFYMFIAIAGNFPCFFRSNIYLHVVAIAEEVDHV